MVLRHELALGSQLTCHIELVVYLLLLCKVVLSERRHHAIPPIYSIRDKLCRCSRSGGQTGVSVSTPARGALLTSSDDTLEFDRSCVVLRGQRLRPCNSICKMALAVVVYTPCI